LNLYAPFLKHLTIGLREIEVVACMNGFHWRAGIGSVMDGYVDYLVEEADGRDRAMLEAEADTEEESSEEETEDEEDDLVREILGTALPQITSLTTFTLFRWIYFHRPLRDWFNDEEQIKCYEDISDAVRARARELARAKDISSTKEEAAVAGALTEQHVEESSLLAPQKKCFLCGGTARNFLPHAKWCTATLRKRKYEERKDRCKDCSKTTGHTQQCQAGYEARKQARAAKIASR
jgi:hypothetical protein